MSQLTISSTTTTFHLNVVSFSSPIYGTIASTQVKRMAIYFPIKLVQPDIQFDVVFATEADYEAFQRFVRLHQIIALSSVSLITMNWPERNIVNQTGFIRHFEAGAGGSMSLREPPLSWIWSTLLFPPVPTSGRSPPIGHPSSTWESPIASWHRPVLRS